MNRLFFFLLVLMTTLNRCSTITNKEDAGQVDSISLDVGEQNVTEEDSDSSGEVELKAIVDDFERRYLDTIAFDTAFQHMDDSFRLDFKHYASPIDTFFLPEEYAGLYEMKSYKVKAFVSFLKIIKNGTLITDTLIKRNMFDMHPDRVNKYGVLLWPELSIDPGGVHFSYTVAVPLYDGSNILNVLIDYNGKLSYKFY